MEIADRIVVMQHGQIVQDATPEELNRNPQTAFVMEFLGEAPSFNGIVQDGLMVPDEAGLLSFAVDASVPPGPVTAMLRPYEIQVCGPDERSVQELVIPLVAAGPDCFGMENVADKRTSRSAMLFYHAISCFMYDHSKWRVVY